MQIKLIIQNNKELSSDSVYNLLYYATDKQETAKLLGQDNISKLSYDSVRDLLYSSTERQEMAKLLGQDNVNKLSAFLHKSFAINDHQQQYF